MRLRLRTVCGLGVGLLACASAEAHIVSVRLGDFFMGVLHPATDPVDWLLWLGVVLMAVRAGRGTARWLMAVVPVGMALGLAAGVLVGRPAPALLVDDAPMLIAGLMLAGAVRLPTAAVVTTAVALMGLRGWANVAGLRDGANIALYAAGLMGVGYVVATLAGALCVDLVGETAPAWRRIAARVLGSWMAAAALMLFALGLRG